MKKTNDGKTTPETPLAKYQKKAKKTSDYRDLKMKPVYSKGSDMRLGICEPRLVSGGKAATALQFQLVLSRIGQVEAEVLLTETGWRVMKGKIYPPARRVYERFIPIVVPSQAAEAFIGDLLRKWWVDVPEIYFPGQPKPLEVDDSEDEVEEKISLDVVAEMVDTGSEEQV